jgi:voltage-gated potassium channel
MYNKISSLTISIAMLFSILLIGTAGYIVIEDYSLVDAIFMTIITVSTVGYNEVEPLSPKGEIFTIFMIIFSFGAFAYAVTSITRFVIDGEFRNYFINKKTARKIKHLNNHIIICGYGRNGFEAARTLKDKGEKFVVVEDDPDIVDEIRLRDKLLYVEGDSTDEDVLRLAGIHKARALISTLPNDADNLLVVFSARGLHNDMLIISRASHEWSNAKLKKAGANNVIMPDLVGGRRMAKLVAQPNVISFLNYMMRKQRGEAQLVELSCNKFSKVFREKTIEELKFKKISGVNIIGLKDTDSQYFFNPDPKLKLLPTHKLFVMGNPSQIKKLQAAIFD